MMNDGLPYRGANYGVVRGFSVIPQKKSDLKDPRPDECFDEMRLAEFLSDKLEGADKKLSVQQFSGGLANLTYLLKFGDRFEYVYRRPPLGEYAPSAHDMSREYRVLSALDSAFKFAPRLYLYVEDSTVMGAPFLIMERRRGTVVRREMPDHFSAMSEAPRLMSEALVDVLVEFHAIDSEAVGLADLGRPKGFIRRQVEGWKRRWDAAKLQDNLDVEAFNDWLTDNIPESSDASLVHNDYKLDNTMLADDDPSRLVAVLDWDMCTLGDPLLDLGTLLTYWTEPDDPPYLQQLSPMPSQGYDFLTRRQIVERYALKSGRDVDCLRFYHVLAMFRWLVFLQQMYIRYVRGLTKDERFARLNVAVDLLAKTALETSRGRFE